MPFAKVDLCVVKALQRATSEHLNYQNSIETVDVRKVCSTEAGLHINYTCIILDT